MPSGETGVVSAFRAMAKITMPVPSLNRLSASIRVVRRGGARRWPSTEMTAAGSVAASMVPTRKAIPSGIGEVASSANPTATAVSSTPGTASRTTAGRLEYSSRASVR